MRYLLLILTISSMASCCANKNNSKERVMDKNEPIMYTVKQVYNNSVFEENVTITINYADKTISGYSGCNNFSGSFTEENGSIKIGPLASTKKMCPDISDETMLFKALANTEKITVESNTLELMNSIGESILKASTNEKAENNNQDNITFEYTAISRGFYLTVYISNIDNMLLVTKHRDMKPAKQTYSKEDWDKLIYEMNTLDIKELETIQAPTKAHQYDGAAIATLKITVNQNVYSTMAFDHGNPPEKIKELVNNLISFSEKE